MSTFPVHWRSLFHYAWKKSLLRYLLAIFALFISSSGNISRSLIQGLHFQRPSAKELIKHRFIKNPYRHKTQPEFWESCFIFCAMFFMTQEDDKAEAPEDEMVVKGHDVEKKHNWNQSLKNRRRGSRKLWRRKRWIMLHTIISKLLISLTPKRH